MFPNQNQYGEESIGLASLHLGIPMYRASAVAEYFTATFSMGIIYNQAVNVKEFYLLLLSLVLKTLSLSPIDIRLLKRNVLAITLLF